MVEDLREKQPWESHYLASFGAEIDGRYQDEYFPKTAKALSVSPQVLLAIEAESDIKNLRDKFYEKYDYFNGDTKEIPARRKYGLSLSEKYPSIPHGNLLKLMGRPSPGP